jgi:hypothetical protein
MRLALAQLAAGRDRGGARGEQDLAVADVDLDRVRSSTARRLFWRDRRPRLYRGWLS